MSNLRTKSPKIDGKATLFSFAVAFTEADRDNTTALTAAACSLVSTRLFFTETLLASDASSVNALLSSSACVFISSAVATCCCNSSLQATAPAAMTILLIFCNATLPALVAAFTFVHWPKAGPKILPDGSSIKPRAFCSLSAISPPESDVSSAMSSHKSSVHVFASPFNGFPCKWVTMTSDFAAKARASLVASTIMLRLCMASSVGGEVGGSAGSAGSAGIGSGVFSSATTPFSFSAISTLSIFLL
mmetsp:Transcript_108687/g.249201  ORF Transcript_108687/g.249201 Transcript_108687/m.249201 type:complete len:246 (-) Transcript_108687:909-1646(-)